jgi:[ribosomal protein S18]-alanine N-acetyltransferase
VTPETLAQIHAAAFRHDRAWSAREFAELLTSSHVALMTRPQGFALTRTLAGESELLTIAVAPAAQNRGIGGALMGDWLNSLAGRADTAFLEVAADNLAAIALYARHGFAQIACRRGYYARAAAAPVDALIMQRTMTRGQAPDSTAPRPESS